MAWGLGVGDWGLGVGGWGVVCLLQEPVAEGGSPRTYYGIVSLAKHYHSLEKLLGHEKLARYVAWKRARRGKRTTVQ